MATSNAFAFKQSGLDAFLFAVVGTELNGSPLTILSVLARLGQDPWAEAANWTKLSKSACIDRLTDSIGRMPLMPQALAEARATAARLVPLLPAQASLSSDAPAVSAPSALPVPRWVLVAVCAVAIGLGFGFNYMAGSSQSTAVTPIGDLRSDSPQAPPH